MTVRATQKVLKGDKPAAGDTIGAEGRPLREYVGWDDAAGVFRQDDPALRPKFQSKRSPSRKPAQPRK